MSKSILLKLFATTLLLTLCVGCAEFHSKQPFCSAEESIRNDDFWARSWTASIKIAFGLAEEDASAATFVWDDESRAYRVAVVDADETNAEGTEEIRFFRLGNDYFANIALDEGSGPKNYPAFVGALDDETIEMTIVAPWVMNYRSGTVADFDEKTIETALKLDDDEFSFEKSVGGDFGDFCSGEIDVATARLQRSLSDFEVCEYAPAIIVSLKSETPFSASVDGLTTPEARRRYREKKADIYVAYLYKIAEKTASEKACALEPDEAKRFATLADKFAKETTNPKSLEKLEFVKKTFASVADGAQNTP